MPNCEDIVNLHYILRVLWSLPVLQILQIADECFVLEEPRLCEPCSSQDGNARSLQHDPAQDIIVKRSYS